MTEICKCGLIEHIRTYLKKGEDVVCKICGVTHEETCKKFEAKKGTFNLSEKIFNVGGNLDGFIHKSDIKEFIQRLKEYFTQESTPLSSFMSNKIIDELAGKDLK